MKIEGSILTLIGRSNPIFDASYTGKDANLNELKHAIVDLIKRSWKFYNDFLDAENTNELSKLEMYGAFQIASNSSDVEINLFYRNYTAIEDCLYHLYFKLFLNMVDTWSIHRGEIDSFKESISAFEDKYSEDLTKICLLVGIYIESLDARYMHIKKYAYYSLLDDEKELENFRQSSHYKFVVNRLPKIDVSTADSYENMTEDELIDEFVKFGIENTKLRDKIFGNE